MSSSLFSRRRRLAATIAALVLIAGAGCGDGTSETTTPANGQDTTPPESTDGPPQSLPPGPDLAPGTDTDGLVISASTDDDYITSQIAEAGGTVVGEVEETGLIRARFGAGSLSELVEIRDRLRAAGVDASVNLALPSDELGGGTRDAPA